MKSFRNQELHAVIRNADSPDWSVRAAVGRRLAASEELDAVAEVVHRLLLDAEDTAVSAETAEALLLRGDTVGLRCVLLGLSRADDTGTADEIRAALDGDPAWMTTPGADRLIGQLHELAGDEDAGVREEAHRILARLRPREEWAQDPADVTAPPES